MKLSKAKKNKKGVWKTRKMPFTVRGYQYYYGAIILIVLLIGFSQVFS
tara:strand:- start:134 stop:277 length:144 start_codon:yes stop_codon:yes gene_type:complete